MTQALALEEPSLPDGAEAVLLRLADRLGGQLDPTDILAIAAEEVGRHLGANRCGYGEVDLEQDQIVIPVDWADGVPSMVGRYPLHRGSILVRNYEAGRTGVLNDADAVELPDAVRANLAGMQCKAFVAAPLLDDHTLVGLFAVHSRTARAWTRAEIELVERTAVMTWSALRHARTGAKLRESEETFRLLADNIPGICWLANPEGQVYWLNAVGRRYFGEAGDVAQEARAIIHPDDVGPAMALWSSALREGATFENMLRVRGEDNEYRPFLSRAAPIRNASGAIVRWCGVLVDLTERQAQDRRQALLRDFQDRVRDSSDVSAILAAAAAALAEHLAIDEILLAERRSASGDLALWRYLPGGTGGEGETIVEAGADALKHMHRDGEPLVIDDWADASVQADLALRASPAARQDGASLNQPISQDGRIVAVLSAQTRGPRHWTPEEVELCGEMADRLCSSLSRARADEALRDRDWTQAFLIDWNDALRQVDTPDDIMAMTLESLGRYLGVTRVTYAENDATGRVFTTRWNWSDGCGSLVGLRVHLDTVGAQVEQEWLTGKIVRYDDVTHDPHVGDADRATYAARQIAAFISIPLVRRSAVQAILSVQSDRPRHWRDAEIGLIRDLGERAWPILERARAQAELRERERNQSLLVAWNDRIRDEASPRAILSTTLAMIGAHLGVNRANYAEGVDGEDALEVQQEWRDGTVSVVGQRFPLAAFGERIIHEHLSGAPIVVRSVADDPRFDEVNRPLYQGVGVAAFVSVPMVRNGRIEGVLSVQSEQPRDWATADVQLLRDLGDRTWAVLERAQSEERMAETEALLDAFMENAPFGMHLKDAHGRYLRMNPELGRQIAVPVEHVVGRRPEEFLPPEMARRVIALERRALAGEIASEEFLFPHRTDYTALLAVVFPIEGRRGVAQTGGFTLDLTARKAAEAALQKSRDALHQSEKLTALGSLLAGVSHELNNPLSIVVAQAVMMERQAKDTDLAERAFKIRRAADRCARIVQTFLAMARQKRPERSAVDLNAVVDAALELAGYGLRTDGITVEFRRAEALPTIAADADQLHQIIVNLLVNAQHAMAGQTGERTLTLSTAIGPEPETVILDVADNGPGVAEELARRVFEPFFTTKDQGEGTGLGLSFSQGLAEAHGGRLTLVSRPEGACFRLTLPVDAEQVLPPVPLIAPPPAEAVERRRALLVDDEEEIAASLADFLMLEGYACEIATSGAAACEKMRAGDYDLVVSDLRMPVMDGTALHAWMRRERPDLADRLGFVTGDTLGTSVARFLAETERPVLEKPFSPETVGRFVREVNASSTEVDAGAPNDQ